MSNSMALTFQEVPSRFGSGSRDRPETLVWSLSMEPDWKEAQQVGDLSVGSEVTWLVCEIKKLGSAAML